jgi:hypothetical protein
MQKPHLLFKNPSDGVATYKQRKGGGPDEEEKDKPNYDPLIANQFAISLIEFQSSLAQRYRNRTLQLPIHFDLIEIEFQAYFDQSVFQQPYYNDFGLDLVHISLFNRKGLFIIDDENRFEYFFKNIKIFIDNVKNGLSKSYHPNIRYIKSFKLFRSEDMIRSINNYSVLHFSLINNSLRESTLIKPQRNALKEYFIEQGIQYSLEEENLEVYDSSPEMLKEIIDNFDIIYATCSGSGTIIRPDAFNTPRKEFGFTITNFSENLPIIGIIDSGVSNITPLKSIIIDNAEEYDLTGTGVYFDNVDHGTGVACLAALGERLIPGYRGEVISDAKILPIKIINGLSAPISQQSIINIIRKANQEFGVKIFTLTVGYTDFPLKDNQEFSSYATALDQLAFELDIIIFISTTNNCRNITDSSVYPDKLLDEDANIASPAESMNNITVGAISDNFEEGAFIRRSRLKDFPTIYNRRYHYNFDSELFNNTNSNKQLFKPDILMAGGDYENCFVHGADFFEDRGRAAIEVLSSNPQERTNRWFGTSYSSPLAANLAAKLIKVYPNINMQSVKALIINSSKKPKIGDVFNNFTSWDLQRLLGHGIPDQSKLLFSSEKQVTILLEDSISLGEIKTYQLRIPEYLVSASREKSLLKISATLCFKFDPHAENQLLYCPLHIAFTIGKNLSLNEFHEEERTEEGKVKKVIVADGYNGNSSKEIKLSTTCDGWSQDYYYKAKPVSNAQKISINVSKSSIIENGNILKLAINADYQKLLPVQDKEKYQYPIGFSIAINIEQFPIKNEVLENLYDELVAVNRLESMAVLEGELEIGLEV